MLSVAEFGRQLVETGDLDPIYLMLNAGVPDWDTRARWCVAYWMFYHAGTASRIAEVPPDRFWDQVWKAQLEKWPRGTERRHFKGEQSRLAIETLSYQFPEAREAAEFVAGPRRTHPIPASQVMERAQQWRGFGPWISFKIADMVDAVLQRPVDFTDAVPQFFDDPKLGAFLVASIRNRTYVSVTDSKAVYKTLGEEGRGLALGIAVRHLQDELWNMKAPHANRELRIQEFETILCKYKSHLNGRYPVGKDTKEILHGLKGQGALAAHLRDVLARATGGENGED